MGVLASWLPRLERAILSGLVDRPRLGDEIIIGESVIVLKFPQQHRCGCIPAAVEMGRTWHQVVRLCTAHSSVLAAPPPPLLDT